MKKFKKSKGVTLIELLVILAIIALLILAAIFTWRLQLAKGRDARRKADLNNMKNILEDYYNDTSHYPAANELTGGDDVICNEPFLPYTSQLVCDPLNNSDYHYHYYYQTNANEQSYIIYTKFENENDPAIAEVGCSVGCGPDCEYNYGIASQNASLVVCSEADIHYYICQGAICNDATGSEFCPGPGCYANDPTCGGGCP